MKRAYLGLGSNLGSRENYLKKALEALRQIAKVTRTSPVYQTPPWGEENQPAFLNACIEVETELKPEELLDAIKQIELKVGRTKTYHWGPREIDIDILFYDDLVLDSQRLTIPHPRLTERAFVLVPLFDIAPDLIHPQAKTTVKELLKKVSAEGITKYDLNMI